MINLNMIPLHVALVKRRYIFCCSIYVICITCHIRKTDNICIFEGVIIAVIFRIVLIF